KQYSNDDITIVWEPDKCIHSKRCWQGESGLLSVFNPSQKPWINARGAPSEQIIVKINQCPSGALSYYQNVEEASVQAVTAENVVEVLDNGPVLVHGNITLQREGSQETRKSKVTAFCRCRQSSNKPFCDGTHVQANFKG